MKRRNPISTGGKIVAVAGAVLVLGAALTAPGGASAGEPEEAGGPAVPAALAWGPEGARLYVALRDERRVVSIDPRTWTVSGSWDVPVRPVSLALADDRGTFLLGGSDGHVVVLETAAEGGGRVVRDLAIGQGHGPTRVLPLPEGRAAVAAQWERVLHLIDWRLGRVLAEHRLGFAPGALVRRPDGRIVVADAFGGRLADLRPEEAAGRPRHFSLDGINLHALGISQDGKELLIVHMFQGDDVPITTGNIDAGTVISSVLSAIRLSDLDADADVAGSSGLPEPPLRRLTLDGPVHGAADPAALALTPDGLRVVIALAGSHQILINDRSEGVRPRGAEDLLPLGHNLRLSVVAVGRGPVAVVVDRTGTLAITADAMSDTLTVIRLADRARLATVPLGPASPRPTAAQRGEALFHDGRRSHDRWMSCASCHPGGHTNGLNFDTFGDSGFGAPKNTPSLLGVKGTEPFTWTGHFERLGDQVRQSFETSLRGDLPDPELVADLVAYLESLAPPRPLRSAGDPAAVRGAAVFQARRCQTCHEPPLYTIAATRDVGLDDGVGGHHRFNPPSLRGLAWTAPYFHDGRAASLADVLKLHTPGKTEPLDPQDRDDLIAFLESL
jgi:cytochrome c peroxidase